MLAAVDAESRAELRAVLAGEDDYASAGKPACGYDDPEARAVLIDGMARDGMALLRLLEGEVCGPALRQATALLATVLGQDLEHGEDGIFCIAVRVAKDPVISTVDPQARHGRKMQARGFDGYKGHLGVDPDAEIITATTVTPGNAGDAAVAEDLISDLTAHDGEHDGDRHAAPGACVYGDNAYGTGELHDTLERSGVETGARPSSPPPRAGYSPRTSSTSILSVTP